MIDSLIFLLAPSNLKSNGNDIYYYARSISPPANMFLNDRAIQQLKSSGGLRLINNMEVSDAIMAYDKQVRELFFTMTDEISLRSEYRQQAAKVFKGDVFNDMVKGDKLVKPDNNPQLFTDDAAMVNELMIYAQYLKKANQDQQSREEKLLAQAKQLLELLKKDYHLE